jgi:hypothetical protein
MLRRYFFSNVKKLLYIKSKDQINLMNYFYFKGFVKLHE